MNGCFVKKLFNYIVKTKSNFRSYSMKIHDYFTQISIIYYYIYDIII